MKIGYCRICCLEFDEDMLTYSLFDDSDENNLTEIGQMFVECLFKGLEPNNGYFDHLCSECTSKLKEFSEFRSLAFDASQKFEELQSNYDIDGQMHLSEEMKIEPPTIDDIKIEPIVFSYEEIDEVNEFSTLNEYKDTSSFSCVKIESITVLEDSGTEEYLINPDESRMKRRIATGSSPQSKGFKCKLCNTHFKFYREFSSHNRVAHSQCEVCHIQLNGQSNLETHMETVHQKLECRYCREIHFTVWTLARHEARHRNGSRSNLPHLRDKQLEKLSECEICHKKLKGPDNLRMHMDNVHRELMCRHCGETNFNTVGALTRHEARHTNERPFVCHLCDKCFPSEYSLKIHHQGHTNQRRFICEICGSKFRNKSHMKSHLQSHNVEKFKCEFCDKTFQRSTSQRVHREEYHLRRNLAKCSLCGKVMHFITKHKHVLYHKKKGEVAIMRRIPDN